MSGLDTLVEVFTESERSEETTGKHVSGTVGVDDFVVGELWDGVRLWVGVGGLEVGGGVGWGGRGDEGRFGALGDDDETGLGGVGLVERSEFGRDSLERVVLRVSGGGGSRLLRMHGKQGMDVWRSQLTP